VFADTNDALYEQHRIVVQEFLKVNVLHPAADLRNLPVIGYVGGDFPNATRTEVAYLRPLTDQVTACVIGPAVLSRNVMALFGLSFLRRRRS
jgi:hypothetical protein